jgi:hypothetical protein
MGSSEKNSLNKRLSIAILLQHGLVYYIVCQQQPSLPVKNECQVFKAACVAKCEEKARPLDQRCK